MKNSKLSSVILLIFTALLLTNCGGSSNGDGEVSPFADGDALTSLQGDWFGSECVQNFNEGSSSLEKLEFSFREPLSWDDDFFKDDSLEFTGSLSIKVIEFDNAYCLGSGIRSTDLIESNVALNNLSIIQSSLTENSFKAFYAQNKEYDFEQKLDVGEGILLDFVRTQDSFLVTPINRFTYLGQNFDLQEIENSSSFIYQNHQSPVQSQNIEDVSLDKLRRFLDSPTCGTFYSVRSSVIDDSGDLSEVFIVMEPSRNGLKFSYLRKAGGLTEEFHTSGLDWFHTGFVTQTEKGFTISELRGSSVLQISHSGLNIDENLSIESRNRQEMINHMKERGLDPFLFETCN